MHFFIMTMLAVVYYAVRGGIVALARTVEFFFFLFSFIFAALFFLSLTNVEIINLLPVTYYDIWPLAKASYSVLGIWGYFTFIFFFGDEINDKEHIKRFGIQGTAYLLIAGLMVLIQTIGAYGYTIIKRLTLPYFTAIKGISILDTIERIESVALGFWVIVDFVIISVFVYIIISIIKSLFSLSEKKNLLSPVVIFAYIFSFYITQNRFELENFSNDIGLPANIALGFVFPFITYAIGKLRKII